VLSPHLEMLRSPSSVQTPEEMLSSHSIRRDQYGIPIVQDRIKSGRAHRWNECHRSLASITGDVRGLQQRIEFIENWLLRYLKPITYPFTHQSTDGAVDVTNETLVESEVAVLKDRFRRSIRVRKKHCGRLGHLTFMAKLPYFVWRHAEAQLCAS
jgi:hypothetical protein